MQRYHARGRWGGECPRQKEQHVLRPGVRAYPSPCPSPAPLPCSSSLRRRELQRPEFGPEPGGPGGRGGNKGGELQFKTARDGSQALGPHLN